MRDWDANQRFRMTFVVLLGAVAVSGGGGVAFLTGHIWLAVALFGVAYLMITVPEMLWDPDDRVGDRRWGPEGQPWSVSDADFEELVREVESGARAPHAAVVPPQPERWFEYVLSEAIEDLPEFVRAELDKNVAVVVADDGRLVARYGSAVEEAYGLYVGWTSALPNEGAKILLFRDTLMRDFPDEDDLRREITLTLRHEIAHHFGADEDRVRQLGL